MRHLKFLALFAMLLAPGHPAAQAVVDSEAQISAANLARTDDATTVEAVTVQPDETTLEAVLARGGAPQWWIATPQAFGSQRTAPTYILGVPWLWPEELYWPPRDFQRAFAQADQLILPPAIRDTNRRRPLIDEPLPDVGPIPPELVPALSDAARALGQAPECYTRQHPYRAGYLLAQDFRRTHRLSDEQVLIELVDMVVNDPKRGTVHNAGAHRLPAGQAVFEGLTREGSLYCLRSAIAEVAGGAEAVRRAAAGWRAGMTNRALQAPRALDQCAYAAPALAELRRQAMDDTVQAIQAFDNTGAGRRIVVAYLRPLTAEGGILDSLRARGYTVTGPGPLPEDLFGTDRPRLTEGRAPPPRPPGSEYGPSDEERIWAFGRYDANQDQRLDRTEYRSVLRNVPAPRNPTFGQLDADRDGLLTFEEYRPPVRVTAPGP